MNRSNDRKATVIIPAYNEEKTIGAIITSIRYLNKDWEIIVIDDCSKDNTNKIANELKVKVISHPYNKGYGASLKTGIKNASHEHIITVDADGQHNIDEIPAMLNYSDSYDMIIGVRKRQKGILNIRDIQRLCINTMCGFLLGCNIPDVNSGFRIFSRDKAMKYFNILPNSFSFSTTITLSFLKEGFNVKFYEINSFVRKFGKSRVNIGKDSVRTILLILRVVVLFNPLKIFFPISLIMLIFGVSFSAFGIVAYSRVPATGIISIIGGLNILFFGILADQLAALRRGLKE